MKLHELIEGFPLRPAVGGSPGNEGAPPDLSAVEIHDLTDDSRTATPGCLFIARAGGKADGRTFIADAVKRGAVAVLMEDGAAGAADLGPWAVALTAAKIDNALVGRLAERFFGNPSQQLKLIGVTGTKGKTTVAYVVQHLLRRAGVRCGMIGTVVIDDGATQTPAELTTPGAVEFSRYLAAMVKNGCGAAVAEVSSHALHQGRTAALDFGVAVFTNLTGDHLDYHGTMENYAAAKAVLFENLRPDAWAVVNATDPWVPRIIGDCGAKVIECALTRADKRRDGVEEELPGSNAVGAPVMMVRADGAAHAASATILSSGPGHSRVRIDGPWGSFEVRLPLVGRHNVMNVLQATAAANCVASLARTLSEALEACPAPPGRLEVVRVQSSNIKVQGSEAPADDAGSAGPDLPTVLVDYAHTHDALEKVLLALRPLTPRRGRLIALFGCGGDRDRTKRPKMAAVCCKLADRVIITSDNPRTERPDAIIREVLAGVPPDAGGKVTVEADRAKAIAMAIEEAGPDDVVLLAGKGHENYQIVGTTKRHFDDREEAAAALRKRLEATHA